LLWASRLYTKVPATTLLASTICLTHSCAVWQTVRQVVLALSASVHVQITMKGTTVPWYLFVPLDTPGQASQLFLGVATQNPLHFVNAPRRRYTIISSVSWACIYMLNAYSTEQSRRTGSSNRACKSEEVPCTGNKPEISSGTLIRLNGRLNNLRLKAQHLPRKRENLNETQDHEPAREHAQGK